MALPHTNILLETRFVLLPKIIAYAFFQLSLSHWFVITEIDCVDRILKTLSLMEKFDSQPRLFMLPTINSFKLMKSNYEYQIMNYFLATLCQNVVPQNKLE